MAITNKQACPQCGNNDITEHNGILSGQVNCNRCDYRWLSTNDDDANEQRDDRYNVIVYDFGYDNTFPMGEQQRIRTNVSPSQAVNIVDDTVKRIILNNQSDAEAIINDTLWSTTVHFSNHTFVVAIERCERRLVSLVSK